MKKPQHYLVLSRAEVERILKNFPSDPAACAIFDLAVSDDRDGDKHCAIDQYQICRTFETFKVL